MAVAEFPLRPLLFCVSVERVWPYTFWMGNQRLARGWGFGAALTLAWVLGVASSQPARASSLPGGVGTLSIVPGLGQMVNGNFFEGLGWLGAVAALYGSGNSQLSQAGWDLWMYQMYDAYRDAGASGAAKHSVYENYAAFLNPLNLIDPIGAPLVAFGAAAGSSGGYPVLRSPSTVLMYGFVGLGEEGLFRGFLYPSFSQNLGSRWLGAITSSAAFAAIHATGGKAELQATPMIQRFIGGMLFCWQVERNHADLRKNIFAHAWYDIFVDDGGKIQGLKMKIPF